MEEIKKMEEIKEIEEIEETMIDYCKVCCGNNKFIGHCDNKTIICTTCQYSKVLK